MIRHIIYLVISFGCSIGIYFYALPNLPKFKLLYNFVEWIFQYIWVNIYHISQNLFLILFSIFLGIIIFILIEIIDILNTDKPKITKDSARWANKKDVQNLMKKKGVPVGRFNGKILYYDEKPLITCAGTRSGKGVGAIIPTLLEYPNSVFCLDIKGENYKITAKRRSQISKVFAINPFGVLKIPTASYNWLDSINIENSNCITKANKMASMIVGRSGANSPDSHFDNQAIRLLQGVILYVCAVADPSERNICTVKKLIHTMPIDDLCQEMAKYDDVAYGEISSIGLQFLNNANEKEKGSIVSTAQRATNFLGNPDIQKTLEKSDFDISQLPSKLMSIYLIMEQDQIDDFKAYIRVFFDLALSSIISQDIDRRHDNHEVLFLLDEVAQLGYMKSLANAVSIIRGMGGQLWFFFQSYSQLKSVYGDDAQNILSNCAQIYYGCNDIETAELISKNLGDQKVVEYDIASKKDVTVKKRLLEPYQVRKLKAENPIIIISGINPIKVKKLCYFKDKEYKGLFDENPYLNK